MIRKFEFLLPLLALFLAACSDQSDSEGPVTVLEVDAACDIQQGCTLGAGQSPLVLQMGPGLKALQPFPVQAVFEGEQKVDALIVTFSMEGMNMGLNRYRLISDGASSWFANVNLPVCISGRADWFAEFEWVSDGRRFQARVPFVLEK